MGDRRCSVAAASEKCLQARLGALPQILSDVPNLAPWSLGSRRNAMYLRGEYLRALMASCFLNAGHLCCTKSVKNPRYPIDSGGFSPGGVVHTVCRRRHRVRTTAVTARPGQTARLDAECPQPHCVATGRLKASAAAPPGVQAWWRGILHERVPRSRALSEQFVHGLVVRVGHRHEALGAAGLQKWPQGARVEKYAAHFVDQATAQACTHHEGVQG